jgi:hypothetical protein
MGGQSGRDGVHDGGDEPMAPASPAPLGRRTSSASASSASVARAAGACGKNSGQILGNIPPQKF